MPPDLSDSITKMFWDNVKKTQDVKECWTWQSFKRDGYGLFRIKTHNYGAHRLSYYLHYGVDPLNNIVRHQCHNKSCCNPSHLLLGTNADNYNDSVEKYRSEGIYHWSAKLTKEQALSLREEYATGKFSQAQLGIIYGISSSHVGHIVLGKSWKDIPLKESASPRSREKLTPMQVECIIREYNNNLDELAKKYAVNRSHIRRILLGQSWSNKVIVGGDETYNKLNYKKNLKLTEAEILSIIDDHYVSKVTFKELGKRYGVSVSSIHRIINRKGAKYQVA